MTDRGKVAGGIDLAGCQTGQGGTVNGLGRAARGARWCGQGVGVGGWAGEVRVARGCGGGWAAEVRVARGWGRRLGGGGVGRKGLGRAARGARCGWQGVGEGGWAAEVRPEAAQPGTGGWVARAAEAAARPRGEVG